MRLLGSIASGIHHWDLAVRLLGRAYDLQPDSPRVLMALADTAGHVGEDEVGLDSILGLVVAPGRDLTTEARLIDRAIAAGGESAELLRRQGEVAAASGALDAAAQAFQRAVEVDAGDADGWYRLGRITTSRAAARGAFMSDDFEIHSRAMRSALAADPGHERAAYHLVRVCLRAGDTAAALAAVEPGADLRRNRPWVDPLRGIFEVDVSRDLVQEAADIVSTGPDGFEALSPDFWFVLEWRFHQLGCHVAAARAKRIFARRRTLSPAFIDAYGIGAYVTLVQAYAHLGEFARVAELCDPVGAGARTRRETTILEKLRNDIAFASAGVPSPRYHQLSPDPALLNGEERFRQMVEGRRVAIVGPGAPVTDEGEEIEEFETVIRTKQVDAESPGAGRLGFRTDIAYFADTSTRALRYRIEEALANEWLQLAVFRPSAWALRPGGADPEGRERYATFESLAGLQASPYAIQRILYDIARYEPSAVKIFNVDFFLDGRHYAPEYRDSEQESYRGLIRTGLEGYGHDLRADFEFTKQIVGSGLVDASSDVRMWLDRSGDEYLTALDDDSPVGR